LAALVPGEAGVGDDIGGAVFSPVVEQAARAQAAAMASKWWRGCMDMMVSLLKVSRTLARAGFTADESTIDESALDESHGGRMHGG
jgi:hypothetical protein